MAQLKLVYDPHSILKPLFTILVFEFFFMMDEVFVFKVSGLNGTGFDTGLAFDADAWDGALCFTGATVDAGFIG